MMRAICFLVRFPPASSEVRLKAIEHGQMCARHPKRNGKRDAFAALPFLGRQGITQEDAHRALVPTVLVLAVFSRPHSS